MSNEPGNQMQPYQQGQYKQGQYKQGQIANGHYWNGQQWIPIVHPAPVPAVVMVNKGVSGTEHMLHAIATLLTCGLWIPVWMIRSIMGGQSRSVQERRY